MRKRGKPSTLSRGTVVIITCLLFVVFTLLHIACGDFPKGIDVLPDERRYLEIARSLFAGDGLIIRGAASDFQKILYPLSLFPALLFDNSADQIRMVNVLNSLYACSAVFPALLLARRIFTNNYAVLASVVLVCLSPDLMYSMTFMSEPLYFPLALWMICLCWQCFQLQGTNQLLLAALAGLLCYLLYLCKEVAWMFFIAFICFYIKGVILNGVSGKRAATIIGVFAGCFMALFIIMKLTVFAGLGNSYGQFDVGPLLNPYSALFGLYALAVDGTYFIIGFGVVPLLYLACTYKGLRQPHRDLLWFCFVALIIGLATVVFTISMREDAGHVALRQHLRYVAPLIPVILMLFMKQVAHLNPAGITQSPRRIAVVASVTAAFCVMAATFFGTANLSQGFDYAQFHFARQMLKLVQALPAETFDLRAGQVSAIATNDGALLSITPLDLIFRASVIAFAIVGMCLLFHKRKSIRQKTGVVIYVVIVAFMIANSVCMGLYNRGAYTVEQSSIDQTCEISDELASLGATEQVLIALDENNSGPNNLLDTYLQDGHGAYHYIQAAVLKNTMETMQIGTRYSAYVLVNKNQNLSFMEYDAIPVLGTTDDTFILYRINDESGKPFVSETATLNESTLTSL